jgi:hypothetical protein
MNKLHKHLAPRSFVDLSIFVELNVYYRNSTHQKLDQYTNYRAMEIFQSKDPTHYRLSVAYPTWDKHFADHFVHPCVLQFELKSHGHTLLRSCGVGVAWLFAKTLHTKMYEYGDHSNQPTACMEMQFWTLGDNTILRSINIDVPKSKCDRWYDMIVRRRE